MQFRYGITASLTALLVMVVLLSQGSAYLTTSEQLRQTVREREIDKVKTLGNIIEQLLQRETTRTRELAKLLASNPTLATAATGNVPSREQLLDDTLKQLFSGRQIDLLEITDASETIVYRAGSNAAVGERSAVWGVTEALTGASGIATTIEAKGVTVRAIEPLRQNGRITGTLMTGIYMNSNYLANLSRQIGANLVLVSRSKPVATSAPGMLESLDATAIREAFEQKIPIYREDAATRVTRVYLPVLIVDEGFVVLAEIDSSAVYKGLEKNRQQMVLSALAILIASVIAGIILVALLMQPLRSLRQRAERSVNKLTGVAPTEERTGNEVTSVVGVLDELTAALLTRNRELAEAKAAAEAASDAKSQFLSNMSHEIRTPLNGVLGMAELLQGTPLSEEQRKYTRAITASGRTLHELLSDILDLAKIEARAVKLEDIAFNPVAMVTDIGDAYRELAANRGTLLTVKIDPTLPAQLAGDPTRLRQVLSNLAGNAVKFTEHGEITVGVYVNDRRDRTSGKLWLRFTVRDTGIGIDDAAKARLFQPFTQADSSTTRNFGGTGLGLVICKHLVELMGGDLHLESTLGKGTSLWFDLPFGIPATTAAPAVKAPQSAAATFPVRVLVAEDNAVNKEVIRAMLQRLGATSTIVENGQLAVEAARQATFDLILMDCQMPVLDGY
jgi:signal transduction histidine kinase